MSTQQRRGFAEDYVDVAERLRAWYELHPNARIVTELVELTDTRVTMRASVYRDMADLVPAGVDFSSLAIPGSTPYTRGSELENASTSATGRALVLAGIPSKRIASADEIRNKRGVTPAPEPAGGPEAGALRAEILAALNTLGRSPEQIEEARAKAASATIEQLRAGVARLRAQVAEMDEVAA